MSGSLRLVVGGASLGKHDHWDLCLADGRILRYNDPRRFGALLWGNGDPSRHPLLTHLGPEPLSDKFTGTTLYQSSRDRKVPVKTFLMDSKTVVGVGNIYANESLYMAGIHPLCPAGRLSKKRCDALVQAVKDVLSRALEQGGTTLKDFMNQDGKPGYFQQSLQVYGRDGRHCPGCTGTFKMIRMNSRATYYCGRCQRY